MALKNIEDAEDEASDLERLLDGRTLLSYRRLKEIHEAVLRGRFPHRRALKARKAAKA